MTATLAVRTSAVPTLAVRTAVPTTRSRVTLLLRAISQVYRRSRSMTGVNRACPNSTWAAATPSLGLAK